MATMQAKDLRVSLKTGFEEKLGGMMFSTVHAAPITH